MLCFGRSLVLVVASLFAAAGPSRPPVAPPAETGPFVLGVLRRDGIVSPFAAFDGKFWTSPWPDALRYLDLPITLESVPRKWWGKAGMPVEMAAWSDGERRGTVRLAQPRVIRIMCMPRLGLTSNYRSSEMAPPVLEQPYPKDGLVVSGGQPIGRIETLSRTSPEWVPAAISIIEPFERAEQLAVDAFTEWDHPIARTDRRKVPVEVEAMYRAPMDEPGWYAYYLEAVKRYPPGPDDEDCGLITAASGFMLLGPGKKPSIRLFARVTYCDRKGGTFMLPLGLIKARGRTHWIYQLSGYDHESYVVVEPTRSAINGRIQYWAGSCQR